jgi:hypothetical protein
MSVKRRERDIAIWTKALERVAFCIPQTIRVAVLRRLADVEDERLRDRFKKFADLGGELKRLKRTHWHAEHEAMSLVVQALVRFIAKEQSDEDMAKILFRAHRMGPGNGFLPDYLSRLPGITVDYERCCAICDSNGDTMLKRSHEIDPGPEDYAELED